MLIVTSIVNICQSKFFFFFFSLVIYFVNSYIIMNIFLTVIILTGSSQCIMKDFNVHLCNCIWPFYSQILYSVICKCPDGVAASGYNLHSHLYMALCKKCLSDLLDLDTHMLALLINNVWLCQFILNSKLSSILDPNICEGRYLDSLIYIYVSL